MSRNSKRAAAASAALLVILILAAVSPQRYAAACLNGLKLWLNFIVPTLFPFFVFTALLTKLGALSKGSLHFAPAMQKLFRLPGAAAYCFAMSALSGYPVGSRILCELKENGLIGDGEMQRAAALCSTSGPMFVIGSVGASMFGSAAYGAILLASHLAAVTGVSFLSARFAPPAPAAPLPALRRADNALYESVYGSVLSVLCVGGFIALFFVLTEMLTAFRILLPVGKFFSLLFSAFGAESAGQGFALGLAEVTHGCSAIASSGAAALPPAAFLVTFGGGCILAQQIGYLKKAGVKAGRFIGMKAAQAAAAFSLCLAICAALGLL